MDLYTDLTKGYQYFVVEFLDVPHKNIDQFVCVPGSWIQLREIAEQAVVIKYPIEDLSRTKIRVKNGEPCSDGWSIYVANVKYGTDSYEEAKHFIKLLETRLREESICSELSSEVHESLTISKTSLRKSKQSRSSNQEMTQEYETPSHNGESEPEHSLTSSEIGAHNETSAVQQGHSTRESCLVLNTVIQRNYNKQSGNDEQTENNDSLTTRTGKQSGVNYDSVSFNEDILNRNPSIHETYSLLMNIRDLCADSFTMLDKMMKLCLRHIPQPLASYDPNDSPLKITSTDENEPRPSPEVRKSKRIDTERSIDDDDVIFNEDVPQKIPRRHRNFSLPPDYDEKDWRWTLRNRESAPGLVELVPHTGVYINSLRLKNCEKLSKDSKTLAQMLFVEVFTESALSTCSLTGGTAPPVNEHVLSSNKTFDHDESNLRPALDEHAKTVLINYVKEYAQKNNWPDIETPSILSSISNIMQEMRANYGG